MKKTASIGLTSATNLSASLYSFLIISRPFPPLLASRLGNFVNG